MLNEEAPLARAVPMETVLELDPIDVVTVAADVVLLIVELTNGGETRLATRMAPTRRLSNDVKYSAVPFL